MMPEQGWRSREASWSARRVSRAFGGGSVVKEPKTHRASRSWQTHPKRCSCAPHSKTLVRDSTSHEHEDTSEISRASVDSGVGLFRAARDLLDAAGTDTAGRAAAINHNGYLLIEAPTGSGKR